MTERGDRPAALALLTALILALALGLRVYRLDGQSLWYDEGNSVALAQRDVATIVSSAAADIHPPLYYLLLHVWVRFVGVSDVGVRSLSALVGVLTVLVVFAIGRRWFGATAGLAAACLAAVSPFLIYYSQEARMYALAALLSALAMSLFLRLLTVTAEGGTAGAQPAPGAARRGTALLWLAYVCSAAGAMYSHYFAATVVLAQGLLAAVLLVNGARRRRAGAAQLVRRWLPVGLAFVAIACLYLPWLPVMARQFGDWPAISEFYGLRELVARLFPIFSLGLSSEPAQTLPELLVFAAVLGLGALRIRRAGVHNAAAAHLLVVLWLVVPVVMMYALSLRRPLYNPKFLLVAAPAFCLLLGNGLGVLLDAAVAAQRRPWRALAAALALAASLIMAGASLRSLHAYYSDARYARDDYRSLVQTISASQRTGDAVVLNAPGQIDIFGHYYRGPVSPYLLPQQRPLDERATVAELERIAADHPRLWVVYYGDQQADPRRVIASWLEAHTYKASDRWFGNVRLVLYVTTAGQAGGMTAVQARLGDDIHLLGYRLDASQVTSGDIVPLTLYWSASSAIARRYTVFAHVVSEQGALWGQRDSEPGGGLRPTSTWLPGETIQDNYGLPVLAGTPPGAYQIEVGMYDAATGQRLPVTSADGRSQGDHLLIGPLLVARPEMPPAVAALGMQHSVNAPVGPLRLLGYSLARLGQEPASAEFAGVDLVHLTLFWQAPQQPAADLTVSVQIRDGSGRVLRQRLAKPADGAYPTNGWAAGEVVRDQHRFGLDGLPPGVYQLAIELLETSGRRAGQATLGQVRVR